MYCRLDDADFRYQRYCETLQRLRPRVFQRLHRQLQSLQPELRRLLGSYWNLHSVPSWIHDELDRSNAVRCFDFWCGDMPGWKLPPGERWLRDLQCSLQDLYWSD